MPAIIPVIAGAAASAGAGALGAGAIGAGIAGAAASGLAGSVMSKGAKGSGGGGSAQQATNPGNYPNIAIPGFDYGNGTPTVDMPAYPKMSILPYNMPTLPNPQLATPTLGEQNMGNALSQSQASILALLNPSNPIFKTLSAEQEQLNNQDFLGGLRNIMTTDRRMRAQGRGGLLNSEQGGQQSMMAILNNARNAHLNAQMQARGMLGDVSSRLQSLGGSYAQQAGLEQTRRNQLDQNQLNYTNQVRSDMTNRNTQQRTDMLGAYSDQRDNIIAALNLARNNQATINQANATADNNQRQDTAAMLQAGKDIASKFVGSGTTNYNGGGASTWLNPDTNQYVPIGNNSGFSGLSSFFGS